ncbi:unnamed protein product [Clonostachys rosea]|uniref:NWD NACHT-NTPase N-terminal domain-containing protein n=1 Tax=Bionectria ochroleuca TaxID=29856 RepID=A0ABY6V0B0_BIOOC|nr:unnamed protein product [Clonostachys rosea]
MGKHKGLSGFFHKLRGKKKPGSDTEPSQSTSVASSTTTSTLNVAEQHVSSNETPQTVAPEQATPSKPRILDDRPSVESISKQLWEQAYEKLMSEEEKLVVVYEKVLTQQLVLATDDKTEATLETQNVFADQQFDDKIAHMKQITQLSMDKANRHAKIQQGAGEALQIINSLTPIVSLAMGANPVASIAWAGISTALPPVQMIIRPLVAGKAMADGLTYVIQRLNIYFDFVHVLLQKPDETSSSQQARLREALTSKIADLYTALLRYEMQCVCYCYDTHPAVKALRAMVTLDDFEARLKGLKELESGVERDIGYFAISHSIEVPSMLKSANNQLDDMSQRLRALSDAQNLDRQEKEAAGKEEKQRAQKELTGKFKVADYEQVRDRITERVPGTCEWLRDHEKVQSWLESQASLLVISAGPGCGKSTLAKYFIEDVLPGCDPDATIAYFFFRETEGHRTVSVALSSLLHRILYENHKVAECLQGDIKKAIPDGSQTWNLSGLREIFNKVCQLSQRPRIICVVDALDECDPQELRSLGDLLLETIHHPYNESHPKINFLTTTRGYPEITELFEDKSNCIHLSADSTAESDQIQKDITLVLDHKVERMRNGTLSDSRKEMIKSALLDKSSGQRTYLWLDLVFQVLDRNFNNKASAWERLIHNPPKTVNKAYEDLLRRVNDTERVHLMLDLIVAAERPLSLRELNVALEMSDSQGDMLEIELELESDEDFKKWIIYECGFFLRIYNDQVYLIHQTAKDFLLADDASLKSKGDEASWYHSTTAAQANRALAKCCMSYLSPIQRSGLDEPYQKFKTSLKWFWSHREDIDFGYGSYTETDTSGCDKEFLYEDEADPYDYIQHIDVVKWLERKPPEIGFTFLPYSLTFWARHCSLSRPQKQRLADSTDAELFSLYRTLFKQDSGSQGAPLWYQWSGSSTPIRMSYTHRITHRLAEQLDPFSPEWPEEHLASALFAISFQVAQMLSMILEEHQHKSAVWEGHHSVLIRHAVDENSLECFKILLDNGFLEKSEEGIFKACLETAMEGDREGLVEPLLEYGRHHGFLDVIRGDGSLEAHLLSAFDMQNLALVEALFKFIDPKTDLSVFLKGPLLLAIRQGNLDMINFTLKHGVTVDSSEISTVFNSVTDGPFFSYESSSWSERDLLFNKLLDIGLTPNLVTLTHMEDHIRVFYVSKREEDATFSLRCRKTLVRWMSHLIKLGPFDEDQTKRIVAIAALCPVEPISSLEHLEHEPAGLNDVDLFGNPSFLAAYERSLAKKVADAGIDLCFEWTPLMLPLKSKVFWNFAFFLKAGAEVYDWMVFMAAMCSSGLPMALLFALNKIDSFDVWEFSEELNKSILEYAPWSWNWVYEYQTNMNLFWKCSEGDGLLHIATKVGSLYMMRLLLESGASVDAQNANGESPLHVAMFSVDRVRLLCEHGASVDLCDTNQRTPLHRGLYLDERHRLPESPMRSEEALEITKELLQRKANVEAQDFQGFTPLETMCWYHEPEQLQVVLEELQKVEGVLDNARPSLVTSVCSYANTQVGASGYHFSAYKCIPTLVQFGFDINAQDADGWTCLHHICKGPQLECDASLVIESIEKVLTLNVDVHIKDSSGQTPLHILAVISEELFGGLRAHEVFKVLVDAGIDVNAADDSGQTPLHVVARTSRHRVMGTVTQMAEELIKLGALVNNMDSLGQAPLEILHENMLEVDVDYEDPDLDELNELFRRNGATECTCKVCNPAMPSDLFQNLEIET